MNYGTGKAGKKLFAAVLFVLCLALCVPDPVMAASKGTVNHADTDDYCMRAADVTVNLSELQGKSDSEKEKLVIETSDYTNYEWIIRGRLRGSRVTDASTSFGGVDWTRAGTYSVTVTMPDRTEGLTSTLSYSLTLVDDFPEEEPAVYTVMVHYIDAETGEKLADSWQMTGEEGSGYDLTEAAAVKVEGFVIQEIRGAVTGQVQGDTEITVLYKRVQEEVTEPGTGETAESGTGGGSESQDPEETGEMTGGESQDSEETGEVTGDESQDPEETGEVTGDESQDPEEEKTEESVGKGRDQESKGSQSGGSHRTGSGKTGGKGTKKGGKTGGSKKSSGARSKGKRRTGTVSESRNAEEGALLAEESVSSETVREGLALSEQEAIDAEALQETEAGNESKDQKTSVGSNSLPGPKQGRTVLKQKPMEEKYDLPPLWSMALGALEASVLAVLVALIMSDIKLIRWFEKRR